MLPLARSVPLRLLLALAVAASVALSLVDVRAQASGEKMPFAEAEVTAPPVEPEKPSGPIEKPPDAVAKEHGG